MGRRGQRLPGVQLHPERERHAAALRPRRRRTTWSTSYPRRPARHRLVGRAATVHARGGHVRAARPYTPAPRYAHAAAGVAYPRPAAYDRLPANAAVLAEGPPAALRPVEQHTITTVYRKRVEADLSVDDMIGRLERTNCGPKGLAEEHVLHVQLRQRPPHGRVPAHPGKQTAFDTDIHVPLIVTGPGVPAGTWPASSPPTSTCAPRSRPWPACPCQPRSTATAWPPSGTVRTPPDWRQSRPDRAPRPR